jgi:hypothetical protein
VLGNCADREVVEIAQDDRYSLFALESLDGFPQVDIEQQGCAYRWRQRVDPGPVAKSHDLAASVDDNLLQVGLWVFDRCPVLVQRNERVLDHVTGCLDRSGHGVRPANQSVLFLPVHFGNRFLCDQSRHAYECHQYDIGCFRYL